MSEAEVKRKAVALTKREGGYARRIEDQYSVGFPDLIVRPKGYAICFIEMKIVRGRFFGPTERQLIELLALDAPGTFALVMGWHPETKVWYISPPVKQVDSHSTDCYSSNLSFTNALRGYINEPRS